MRVLQVIDSLEAGGAERMAVNYANSLVGEVDESHLCSTRKEGILKAKISENVGYCFLNKSGTFDRKAFRKLNNYIDENKIDIVQAHGSSWFLVTLIKIIGKKKFIIVWHDHYGNSEFLGKRPKKVLQLFSIKFNGIITVNANLKSWALKYLKCKNVVTFNNFITENTPDVNVADVKLSGRTSDFKLICVANLRSQKDHLTLINAFNSLKIENISLHIIGKNFQDDYYEKVTRAIENSEKSDRIFYYGSQDNIQELLKQGDVGMLTSVSEGLPLIILEYALAGLPIICTDVGECGSVIEEDGYLVKPLDTQKIKEAIDYIYENYDIAQEKALKLKNRVSTEFIENSIVPKILIFYRTL